MVGDNIQFALIYLTHFLSSAVAEPQYSCYLFVDTKPFFYDVKGPIFGNIGCAYTVKYPDDHPDLSGLHQSLCI